MTHEESQIITIIENMSGKYSPYVIFSDWVKMAAIMIQNACCIFHDQEWKEREEQYMNISGKYSKDEMMKFCEMFSLLTIAFEENGINDYLGNVYMMSGAGSKYTGQFFTPFHVSLLTAKMRLTQINKDWIAENGKIKMNEPSAGGGGMILATAKVLEEKGINYQKEMDVVAQDLDWNAVYMTYVQMSLIGIRGIVMQGDTLSSEYSGGKYPKGKILKTPAYMGALI